MDHQILDFSPSAIQEEEEEQDLETSLPPELMEEYKQAFKMMDNRNTGKISLQDLTTVVCSIGIKLTEHEIYQYMQHVIKLDVAFDERYSKILTFPNFIAIMAAIVTECIPEDEVMRIFKEFDKDGDGYISQIELKELLQRYGDDVSETDLRAMMREADQDGDGLVNLREFIGVMSTSHLMQRRITRTLLPTSEDDANLESEKDTACLQIGRDAEDDLTEEELEVKRNMKKHESMKRRKSIFNRIMRRPSRALLDDGDGSPTGSCSDLSNTSSGSSSIASNLSNRRSSVYNKLLLSNLRTSMKKTFHTIK